MALLRRAAALPLPPEAAGAARRTGRLPRVVLVHTKIPDDELGSSSPQKLTPGTSHGAARRGVWRGVTRRVRAADGATEAAIRQSLRRHWAGTRLLGGDPGARDAPAAEGAAAPDGSSRADAAAATAAATAATTATATAAGAAGAAAARGGVGRAGEDVVLLPVDERLLLGTPAAASSGFSGPPQESARAPFQSFAEELLRAVLSAPRVPPDRAASEREWMRGAAQLWDALGKTPAG